VRRTALVAEARDEVPVARVADLPGIVPTLRGKVEFEVSEEGREEEILTHLLRRAIAETFRSRLGGADMSGLLAKFEDGGSIESGELVSATELLRRTGEVPGWPGSWPGSAWRAGSPSARPRRPSSSSLRACT